MKYIFFTIMLVSYFIQGSDNNFRYHMQCYYDENEYASKHVNAAWKNVVPYIKPSKTEKPLRIISQPYDILEIHTYNSGDDTTIIRIVNMQEKKVIKKVYEKRLVSYLDYKKVLLGSFAVGAASGAMIASEKCTIL